MRIIIALFFILALNNCSKQRENLLGNDIRLFEKSPVRELAKAVEREDTLEIKSIAKDNKIQIDYQEPKFGKTLLMLAVKNGSYPSTKVLVESGADPNLQDKYDGTSALMDACNYGTNWETDPAILKLLLKNGGDPNATQQGPRPEGNFTRVTPLIIAAGCCLEKVKLLVEAGANVNYISEFNESALESAFHGGQDKGDIVLYLLIDKNADFKKSFGNTINGNEIRITNLLRNWLFPLDSEEYKKKMRIVDFLRERGEDYWASPVPKKYFKNYPKEYLEKY